MAKEAQSDSTACGFTVVIPAHNEEAVIARCLQTVLGDAPVDNPMQIIVAANGCSDRTVAVAREAAPDALILDLPEGSKSRAMNAAHREARFWPRIFLDADVQCSYRSLAALAEALRRPGVMAASPALKLDLSRSNAFVRAYYRVWLTQPYVTRAMVGSGCFGLSQAAYERIGDFPPVTGDDVWVYSRFSEQERANVSEDCAGRPVSFLVTPPRTLRDQIRVETRRRLGNAEVQRLYPSPFGGAAHQPGDLIHALRGGTSLSDVAIYIATKLLVRIRAAWAARRGEAIVWERDLGARRF